jgi:penicillin-binding protein 2
MRGESFSPQVVRATRNTEQDELQLLPSKRLDTLPIIDIKNWEATINAMVEVIHGKRGTARKIGVGLPFKMAGKTGTAQVFGIKQDEKYDAKTLDKKLHDHALFIAFAPADDPEFVVVVVAENGGGGSHTAAPIARKMIDQYFGIKPNE